MSEVLVTPSTVDATVARYVDAVEAIDVHTHLLPPTHGSLLAYGIDELLTYHYLVAETFMVLPLEAETDEDSVRADADAAITHDEFFAKPKTWQAELVFHTLFVERTPLSEACCGVVTVLTSLGLGDQLRRAMGRPRGERLLELRAWFAAQEPNAYLERVFQQAKVKYAVMTNIPFAPEETVHWMAMPPPPLTPRLKTALRVDPMLTGDWKGICAVLSRCSPPYELSLAGCRAFLQDWIKSIKPIYLMASTPADFTYTPSASASASALASGAKKRTADGYTKEPQEAAASAASPCAPSATELLEEVLLAVASEEQLPLALKVGAVRGVNPALRTGGDGVQVSDLSFVRRLCATFPNVKFLVTVLADANQHELCVLSRKFGNLHVYGCWWCVHVPSRAFPPPHENARLPSFLCACSSRHQCATTGATGRFCNNPSLIERTTAMRLEMLGTAFTAQHSDARVLDQLLYKWRHSRRAIAPVLARQYGKLLEAGWEVREADIERDVHRLFGGAYEEFLAK